MVRIEPVLSFGAFYKDSSNNKALSLALFEEIELLTGLLQQYMEYCDELAALEYSKYADLKNLLMFGVVHFLSSEAAQSYNSVTE